MNQINLINSSLALLLRYILILSPHLRLGRRNDLLTSGLPKENAANNKLYSGESLS
jgi:hypothetical protein